MHLNVVLQTILYFFLSKFKEKNLPFFFRLTFGPLELTYRIYNKNGLEK